MPDADALLAGTRCSKVTRGREGAPDDRQGFDPAETRRPGRSRPEPVDRLFGGGWRGRSMSDAPNRIDRRSERIIGRRGTG